MGATAVASGCFALTVPAAGMVTTRCQPCAALLYDARVATVNASAFAVVPPVFVLVAAAHVMGSK